MRGDMKRNLVLVALLSLSIVTLAQPSVIEKVWTTSPTADGLQEMNARIDKLVTSIQKRHYRDEISKLNALFAKTHNRFLHNYVQYTGVEELAKGRYDCLTATTLFADILSRAGYNYNIIETNYHIFIMVHTNEGDVILETTDRFGGFIRDNKKISNTIAEYRKNTLNDATSAHHQYSFSLYKTVDVDQLAGLLYFNQAVKAFNAEKWEECSEKLTAAAQSTSSPHVAELSELLRRQHYLSGR
jgi:hypothetical protein